jgi:hypothetical protein
VTTLLAYDKKPVSPLDRFGPVVATAIEAVLLGALTWLLNLGLNAVKAGVLIPDENYTQTLAFLRPQNPTVFAAVLLVALPIAIETLLRGLPRLAYRSVARAVHAQAARALVFWLLGTVGALLTAMLPYAFIYAISVLIYKSGEAPPFLWPLALFAFGLWSWRVVNGRGLRYSILLLALYNLYIYAPLLLSWQPQ